MDLSLSVMERHGNRRVSMESASRHGCDSWQSHGGTWQPPRVATISQPGCDPCCLELAVAGTSRALCSFINDHFGESAELEKGWRRRSPPCRGCATVVRASLSMTLLSPVWSVSKAQGVLAMPGLRGPRVGERGGIWCVGGVSKSPDRSRPNSTAGFSPKRSILWLVCISAVRGGLRVSSLREGIHYIIKGFKFQGYQFELDIRNTCTFSKPYK